MPNIVPSVFIPIMRFVLRPDGIIMMEHSASARFENEDDINAPISIAHGEYLLW